MTDSVRQPDLSVYYDRATSELEISKTKLTNTLVLTASLYTSRDLTNQIGNVVFDGAGYNQSDVEIVGLVDAIVKLPFGTLCAQRSYFKDFAPNQTIVSTITSGNGDFIGSKGYITVTVDNTSIRRLDIWLDKQ